MTDPHPLRVIYLAGWGRSGSTLLGNLLGQMPGAFHIGELWNLWEDAFVKHDSCTCGETYQACPFWGPLLMDLGIDETKGRELFRTKLAHLGTRALLRETPSMTGPLAEYGATQAEIYAQVAKRAGVNIIIDSSKTPNLLHLLNATPGIDLHVLHVVRDPRAVAYSWHRRVKRSGPSANAGSMAHHSPARSTAGWLGRNYFISRAVRELGLSYQLLRYEDFVASPESTFASILDRFGLDQVPLSELGSDGTPNHSIRGNPIRFAKNALTIRRDDEWREKMPRRERLAVSAMASPMLRRLGYGFWE